MKEFQALLAPNPKTYSKLVCYLKCYVSKSDKKRCRCKCGGTFHGLGYQGTPSKAAFEEQLLYLKEESILRKTF